MANINDKLTRTLDNLQSNTGAMNLIPSTKLYQLAQSEAYELSRLEDDVIDYGNRISLLTATGEDLDKIGNNIFGIPRDKAIRSYITSSMKALKFYVAVGTFGDINVGSDGLPQDITIPEGTIVSGADGVTNYTFRVSSQVVLPKNANETYIDADLISGPYGTVASNVLRAHNFTNYAQSANNLLLVNNPVAVSSGRKSESDDNYRYKLSRSLQALPRTNYYGIYQTVVDVLGVSSATILQASNGGGSFTVYVQGTTPVTSDETIRDVQNALASSLGPWMHVNVVKPNYVGLELVINVTSSTGSNIDTTPIIKAVTDYINNFYGAVFTINDIARIAAASHPSVTSAVIYSANVHTGTLYRNYTSVGLTNSNADIALTTIDKLIVEPVVGAITVNVVN